MTKKTTGHNCVLECVLPPAGRITTHTTVYDLQALIDALVALLLRQCLIEKPGIQVRQKG